MNEAASLRPGRFLILGHRGSPRRWPENSIASLRAALEEGADGFETDLRRLSDGSTVLFHDRTFDGVATEELEEPRLRAGWPQLAKIHDVVNLVQTHACRAECEHLFDMEIKRRGWEVDVVQAFQGFSNIIVSSFDHDLIAELARGKNLLLGIIFDGSLVDAGTYLAGRGARWYFPGHRHVDQRTVNACHEAGVRVLPWTANTVETWERVLAAGCDGVITDCPAEAVEWRRGRLGQLAAGARST